jgi:hypothetical protein
VIVQSNRHLLDIYSSNFSRQCQPGRFLTGAMRYARVVPRTMVLPFREDFPLATQMAPYPDAGADHA